MSFSSSQLHAAIRSCSLQLAIIPTTYWVAFSGGMDSHVLLHAIATCRNTIDADLKAVYVDHGLQSESSDWAEHCKTICQQLDISLTILQVDATVSKGESPEATARTARYDALETLVSINDVMLTAQHERDQSETVFLQLLRGAGTRGLSAMPELSRLGKGHLFRPLLNVGYLDLQAYAQQHGLQWIEDPSNLESRFDRNLLRQHVLPVLRERWPSLDTTVLRVASQQAEAQQLLLELAEQDSSTLIDSKGSLMVSGLLMLSAARQRNLLRYWLEHLGMRPPSAKKLAQLQHDVLSAAEDRNPCVSWLGCEVRRYRDRLYAMPPLVNFDNYLILDWQPGKTLVLPVLPGTLLSRSVKGQGVLLSGKATLQFRRGGERCQPAGKTSHTSLKKLFQEAGIPPWQRNRTPLVYVGNELAAVAGLCICEPFAASGEMSGFELDWRPS